jgi:ABC-type uncharacterized transport system permease subunit
MPAHQVVLAAIWLQVLLAPMVAGVVVAAGGTLRGRPMPVLLAVRVLNIQVSPLPEILLPWVLVVVAVVAVVITLPALETTGAMLLPVLVMVAGLVVLVDLLPLRRPETQRLARRALLLLLMKPQ